MLSAAGLTLALVLTASRAEAPQPQALPSPVKDKVCKLVNGRWFDGTMFRRRVFYAAGGVLTVTYQYQGSPSAS